MTVRVSRESQASRQKVRDRNGIARVASFTAEGFVTLEESQLRRHRRRVGP